MNKSEAGEGRAGTEGEETQAKKEARVDCVKNVMMVLVMLVLPEKGDLASQEKEEVGLEGGQAGGRPGWRPLMVHCRFALPSGGSGPFQSTRGTPAPSTLQQLHAIPLQGGL